MFKDLDYKKYCFENKIHELFGIELGADTDLEKKYEKSIYESVDPNNHVAFPPELDDLIRLHYLVRSRKATTILEFGVGKSTLVFADAMKKNKDDYGEFVTKNLRRANPFEVHCVENGKEWVESCKKEFPGESLNFLNFHVSDVEMTTFNGRPCTMYKNLPNVSPDLIYLDGPDQFTAKGDIRGISTNSPDRMPMSADILLLEPFLIPGTLIVVDGRTANARFLENNFQRKWKHEHFVKQDIHTFELMESPLGRFNRKQIQFCLGDDAPQLSL